MHFKHVDGQNLDPEFEGRKPSNVKYILRMQLRHWNP